MCLLNVAHRRDPGEYDVDEEEEEEEELRQGRRLPPPGPPFTREIIMNPPAATLQHSLDAPPSPSTVFTSYYRPGEMAAIVTALTRVVSGQRPAGTTSTMPPPSPSPSPSTPSLRLSSPSHSYAPWIGQKRGREEGSSSGVSQTAPARGYSMFGDIIASSRQAERPSNLPPGT